MFSRITLVLLGFLEAFLARDVKALGLGATGTVSCLLMTLFLLIFLPYVNRVVNIVSAAAYSGLTILFAGRFIAAVFESDSLVNMFITLGVMIIAICLAIILVILRYRIVMKKFFLLEYRFTNLKETFSGMVEIELISRLFFSPTDTKGKLFPEFSNLFFSPRR
jgi:hypothetical protein